MKDTTLTARRKKIELVTLLICFIIANLANLYAIIAYHTHFSEMITAIFYIIIFTFVLYTFWTVIRIFLYGIKTLFLKKAG
ncbi:hypothetical protein [Bacteroides sp.]|uniref:hypothetical protein n=1 Tax=Bacteroides sp. TaxID=29523 RepID=UPI0026105304|nr:hypothetical protein [Bacteroides sp.]MDD3036264.1 hypothetical protein [Bacteroides sp.]